MLIWTIYLINLIYKYVLHNPDKMIIKKTPRYISTFFFIFNALLDFY